MVIIRTLKMEDLTIEDYFNHIVKRLNERYGFGKKTAIHWKRTNGWLTYEGNIALVTKYREKDYSRLYCGACILYIRGRHIGEIYLGLKICNNRQLPSPRDGTSHRKWINEIIVLDAKYQYLFNYLGEKYDYNWKRDRDDRNYKFYDAIDYTRYRNKHPKCTTSPYSCLPI